VIQRVWFFSRATIHFRTEKLAIYNWEGFALDIGARKINRDETTRVCAVAKTAEKAGVEALKEIAGGNRYSRSTNSAIVSDMR
jgi:hypothetical protein